MEPVGPASPQSVASRYSRLVNLLVAGQKWTERTILGRTSEHLVTIPSRQTILVRYSATRERGDTMWVPNCPMKPT